MPRLASSNWSQPSCLGLVFDAGIPVGEGVHWQVSVALVNKIQSTVNAHVNINWQVSRQHQFFFFFFSECYVLYAVITACLDRLFGSEKTDGSKDHLLHE